MKQVLPHIQIGLHNDEHVVVVIGDYELADFIEDYLGDDCFYVYLAL
jgi:esterase/lipase superfamily enzyme